MNYRRGHFALLEKFRDSKMCSVYHPVVRGSMAQMAKMTTVYTPISWFDSSPDFINCKNGVLDLETGELKPHSPDDLFTYCLPVDYNPDTTPERWLEFLTNIGLSASIVDYLQLALGYSLTGHTRDEVMFYVYGKTRSGKGTVTEVIRKIFGKLGEGVDMTSFTASRNVDTQRFDLAPLKGKRYLTASETDRKGSLNAAVIKSITGGDEIRCAFKRRDHFSYRPEFKIWLTSNFPVNLDVTDDAAWYRVRVIHFPLTFAGKENKLLKDELKKKAQLEAVFAWMVQGAQRWYKLDAQGLPMPAEVAAVVTEQRYALDTVQQFLDQMCVAKEGIYTVGADLYMAYKSWSEDEGYIPFGRARFTTMLAEKGYTAVVRKVGAKATRCYANIGLLTLSDLAIN
jgi:putative DNA primase/helicase